MTEANGKASKSNQIETDILVSRDVLVPFILNSMKGVPDPMPIALLGCILNEGGAHHAVGYRSPCGSHGLSLIHI